MDVRVPAERADENGLGAPPRESEFWRNHDLHRRSISRVVRAMGERLARPMSNAEMAEIACFSPCHFNRLFHRVTGIPPIQFHYALRIARAKELLATSDLCITDICYEVGYNSLGTFISRFNELVGLSPSGFRRFARRIDGMRLADFAAAHGERRYVPPAGERIVGRIERDGCEDGIVVTGLFRRAIPEGRPSACALMGDGGNYALPRPEGGDWHVLSVAVPWNTSGLRLITFDGLSRGRSGTLTVHDGHWRGDSAIRLSPPTPLDPPILAGIPVFVAHLCGGDLADSALRRASRAVMRTKLSISEKNARVPRP